MIEMSTNIWVSQIQFFVLWPGYIPVIKRHMWEQKKQTYWSQIIIFFLLNPTTLSTFSYQKCNLICGSELREPTTSKIYPLTFIH